ncbi:MAG: CoA-binding protein [Cyanobacteriota bacterium]|nr:CoA-binding protein [Cyanobacteriota bacterium]
MFFKPNSLVLVQGITTPLGRHSAAAMKAYRMNVVAGTSVSTQEKAIADIPVYPLVEQAVDAIGPLETSAICVEPYAVLDAALEAIASGLRQLILVTRGVPPLDMLRLLEKARGTDTLILGPGSAGLIIPEQVLLGAIETQFYSSGNIALIGRTDNLLDEVAWELTRANFGQSMAVNLGTGEIAGSSFETWLPILEEDEKTDAIVIVEQNLRGGSSSAIEFVREDISKPVVAYIAGCQIPQQQYLGKTGLILSGWHQSLGQDLTVEARVTTFKKAKIPVVNRSCQIPNALKKALRRKASQPGKAT